MAEKMIITLVLEADKATLEGLKDEVLSNCARYIVSASTDIIKTERNLKIPSFMVNANYKDIVNK